MQERQAVTQRSGGYCNYLLGHSLLHVFVSYSILVIGNSPNVDPELSCHSELLASLENLCQMPSYDGKYKVFILPESSMYLDDMPTPPPPPPSLSYTTFHTSKSKAYHNNNATLITSRELSQPGPVITMQGTKECLVKDIIDKHCQGCCQGCGLQYHTACISNPFPRHTPPHHH